MRKIHRVVAGVLGAGSLVMTAAGSASADGREGGESGVFTQADRGCAPSFSLVLPSPQDCRTFIVVDNRRFIDRRHFTFWAIDKHAEIFDERISSSPIGGYGAVVNDIGFGSRRFGRAPFGRGAFGAAGLRR